MRKLGARPVSRTVAEQRAHLMREIVETLLFVGLVFVIVHFTIESKGVVGDNMTPQLRSGESVVVNKLAYLFGSPARGDVVLVVDPTDPHLATQLLERVIALPGDTISISATSIVVNGHTLKETYIHIPDGVAENAVIVPTETLGKNQYFVINDNRSVTADSRSWGPVNRSNLLGKAVLVFWPLSNFEGVSNYANVFNGVGK